MSSLNKCLAWLILLPALSLAGSGRNTAASAAALCGSISRTAGATIAQQQHLHRMTPFMRHGARIAPQPYRPQDDSGSALFPSWTQGMITFTTSWPANSPVALVPLQASGKAPHLDWQRTLTTPMQPNNEQVVSLAVDRSGFLYVLAGVLNAAGGRDLLTCKYAPDGTLIWSVVYDNPWNGDDLPVKCALDPEGNLLVAGLTVRFPNTLDLLVIKYDAVGEQQWLLQYNLDSDNNAEIRDMAVDSSGYIYVAGFSWSHISGATEAGFLCKVDPDGRIAWTVSRPHVDFTRLAVGSGATLDAAALTYPGLTLFQFTADGEELWRYEDATLAQWYSVTALQCATDGHALLAGYGILSQDSYSRQSQVLKINPAGELVWRSTCLDTLEREEYEFPDLAVDSRMNCFAVFARDIYHYSPGYILVKFTAEGGEEWRAAEENKYYSAMAVDAAGRLVIGETGEQWGVQIYSPAGKKEGSFLRSGMETGFREMNALAIGADGEICFAGSIDSFYGSEMAVGRIGTRDGSFWEILRAREVEETSYGDGIVQMLLSPQDDIYLLGQNLYKYDRNGHFLWSVPLSASQILIDRYGNLCFARAFNNIENYSRDLAIGKISASGGLLWSCNYDGTSDPDDPADDELKALALDARGNLLVLGRRDFWRDEWKQDGVVLKYSSTGAKLWERAITSRQREKHLDCRALTVDEQGYIYVTGFGWQDDLQESQNFLARYSPAGELIWERYPTRGMDDAGIVYDLALAANGELWLACEYTMRTEHVWNANEIVLIKCDREGKWRLAGRYGIPDGWIGYEKRLHISRQGFVYLMGSIYDYPGGGWYGFLAGFSKFGTPVWDEKLPYTSLNGWDFDPLGNIYVTGEDRTGQNFFTGKYSPRGELLWSASLPRERPSEDRGAQIAVASSGGIFVAGSRSSYAWGESFLLKYDEWDSTAGQIPNLRQNYPNPCRQRTTIPFELAYTGTAQLRLYNVVGQEVLHRDLGLRPAGDNEYLLVLPEALAGGLYFYEIESGGRRCSHKMVVLP